MDASTAQTHGGFPPVEPRRTSGKAIASLILGLFGGPFAVVGLILGIVALREIDRSRGTLEGKGLAIAGIIVSVGTLVISLIALLIVVGISSLLGHSPLMEPPYDIDRSAPRNAAEPEDLILFIEDLPSTQSVFIREEEYTGVTQHYELDARMTVIRFADKTKAWRHCLDFGGDLETKERDHVLLNVPALELFGKVIFPHSFVLLRDSKRRVFAWTNDRWFFSIEAPDKKTLGKMIEASEFVGFKENTELEKTLYDIGKLSGPGHTKAGHDGSTFLRTPNTAVFRARAGLPAAVAPEYTVSVPIILPYPALVPLSLRHSAALSCGFPRR